MGFYEDHILPRMVNLVCSTKPIMYQRKKVVPLAKGRVLEIGSGSGLNLPFYDSSHVEYVWGLDPSAQMRKMAEKRAADVHFEVEFIDLSGDEIPLESNSVNTVLVTYTLCTIPNLLHALSEMGRVLMPGGELIFCEHGRAPDEGVRKWQRMVNPIWKRLAGGCNLNKPIPDLIEQGGFKIHNLETMYVPGWKPASFNYWGSAVQR
ncbi:MAG: class I SAM-dependent methyltransferase [Desulfobacterales bacterium]